MTTSTSQTASKTRIPSTTIDAVMVLALAFFGFLGLWLVHVPWLIANLVLLGLPLTYLLLRSQRARSNIRLKFTGMFIIFGVLAFDYVCERYRAWTGPTVTPFRFPGGVSTEEITWTALYIPLILSIHEHFISRPSSARVPGYIRTFLKAFFYGGLCIALVPFLHGWLTGYTYLKVGLLLQFPVIVCCIFIDRRISAELLAVGIVSGAFNLAFEVLALRRGYWRFPGEYVGWTTILGVRFPVEEFFCLIILSGPSIVATYAIYKRWKRIDLGGSPEQRERRYLHGQDPRPLTQSDSATDLHS